MKMIFLLLPAATQHTELSLRAPEKLDEGFWTIPVRLKLWDTEDITYICHFLIVAAITKLKVLAF